MKRMISSDSFDRALRGELSEEEVIRSSQAVVDAALWSDWSNDNAGLGTSSPGAVSFTSELRVTPERREKLIQSLVKHPERARRLFRS